MILFSVSEGTQALSYVKVLIDWLIDRFTKPVWEKTTDLEMRFEELWIATPD